MRKLRLARLLLVFALAIAVPAQGLAALGSGLCIAFAHHGVLATAAPDAEHAAHDAPAGRGKGHDPYSVHYTACAACGVVAGIAAPIAFSSPSTPRLAIDTAARPAPPGHVPLGVDRPPLDLHA